MKVVPLNPNHFRSGPRGSEDDGPVPLAKAFRGPEVIGYAAILLLFSGFGPWATIATLAAVGSAAIAPGLVKALMQARPRHRRSEDDGPVPLAKAVRGPKLVGYAAIVLFFGGFGAWATVATLASAAIAPGLVSPDGNRKTIEHLEGGIVREILVREGDHVDAGQTLVVLEDVRARAEFGELQERFVHLISVEARLRAELEEADSIVPPAPLDDFDPEIFRPAMSAQRRLFESRQATLQGREKILGQRVLQLEAEIDGLHEVIAAENEQLALIDQEIEGVEFLYKKGL